MGANGDHGDEPHWLVRRLADNYGPQLNATIWFLTTMSLIFLSLRLYCKVWRNRTVWWDDYVLIASWLALAASSTVLSLCVRLGYGKHNADIAPEEFTMLLLYSNAAGFCSILAAVWSKTSFALTLLRISDGWYRRFVWFIIVTVNVMLGTSALFQWIQCNPIEKIWNTEMEGECFSRQFVVQINTAVAAYSGAMDIVLSLLPWKIIWHVAIDKKEKIGALFAMSMGIFAGVTSLLKIVYIGAIASDDIINSVNLLIFGTAEGAITIMACSIPILRALLQRTWRRPDSFSPEHWVTLSDRQTPYESDVDAKQPQDDTTSRPVRL